MVSTNGPVIIILSLLSPKAKPFFGLLTSSGMLYVFGGGDEGDSLVKSYLFP